MAPTAFGVFVSSWCRRGVFVAAIFWPRDVRCEGEFVSGGAWLASGVLAPVGGLLASWLAG